MKSLFEKMKLLGKHLIILDKTFRKKRNYSDRGDYELYQTNLIEFEKIAKKQNLKKTN